MPVTRLLYSPLPAHQDVDVIIILILQKSILSPMELGGKVKCTVEPSLKLGDV